MKPCSRSRRAPSVVVLLVLAALSASLVACTHVKPYERAKLAHPTMTSIGEPGVAEEHMHSVHEGAQGGSANGGGGCGCN